MSKGVIFDLDQTLVDSDKLEPLRKSRNWKEVYAQIPLIKVYDGIQDLFAYLREHGIDVCIVTNSPKPYCQNVVDHFKLPVTKFICFHDVTNRKPHPEPIMKAVASLNLTPNKNIFSIGDKIDDLSASRAAGISTVGALWGSNEKQGLADFKPDFLANTPKDVLIFLEEYWAK